MTENWENCDHFAHFGFSPRSTNFFILHGFSEISQKVFPTFFTFFSARSTEVFKWSNTRFFLLWVAVVALKHWNAKVKTLLSKHLRSILIVSDHFFEKWWPKTTRTDFCKVYELFNLVKSSDLGSLWSPIPDSENVAETWGGCSGLSTL